MSSVGEEIIQIKYTYLDFLGRNCRGPPPRAGLSLLAWRRDVPARHGDLQAPPGVELSHEVRDRQLASARAPMQV